MDRTVLMVLLIVALCGMVKMMTEDEKQAAFQQLLTKSGRLRLSGRDAAVSTTEMPKPQSVGTTESGVTEVEDNKKHDRRHATPKSLSTKPVKKDRKRTHHHAGRHVCTHDEMVSKPVRVVESYCKPTYKSFTQLCSNGTLCTAFKVQFDTIFRTVVKYQAVTEKKHACCPGWTYHTAKHTHSCSQAICSQGCKNGGSCVKPDICTCTPGYTGPSCENDVNECQEGTHRCQQTCNNTLGSYKCGCHDGFHLQEDGRSCKFRLESVPEFQSLMANYEAVTKRLAALEEASKQSSPPSSSPLSSRETMDTHKLESVMTNITDHIGTLENRISRLNETTMTMLTSRRDSHTEYSLASLSEQVGLLEERLADCSCTTPTPVHRARTRN